MPAKCTARAPMVREERRNLTPGTIHGAETWETQSLPGPDNKALWGLF